MYPIKRIVTICLLISVILAILPVYVGLQHNAMGEFCVNDILAPCDLDYLYASSLWLSWLVFIFIVIAASSFIINVLLSAWKALTRR